MENERSLEEDESILASIYRSSADDNFNSKYICTENLEDIWDRSYLHPNINARDDRLKICDCIRQSKNEWKISELSENNTGKGLHKIFKAVVNELKDSFST